MNTLLQPILDSPLLPSYVAELNRFLQEEECKRKFVEELDENVKAEFLHGEIVVHESATDLHMTVLQNLQYILVVHLRQSKKGCVYCNQAMIRFQRSNLMPDLSFWKTEKSAAFTPDLKLYPAPDFIVEVLSPSTEKYDRTTKKDEYALNGVTEYWIIDADKKTIEQYLLEGSDYVLREKLAHGAVQCGVLQGLEIELTAVFDF